MRSTENSTVGVVIVAPSSLLRALATGMLAQGGDLRTTGHRTIATEENPELGQIIMEPLTSDTLMDLTHLIERPSPVPILVFCEQETFQTLFEREGLAANAREDMSGTVVVGEQLLNAVLRAVGNAQLPASSEEPPTRVSAEGVLSAREVEVLALIAEGASNKQISEELSISANTVYTHVSHIQRKLRTSNRTQAALLARAISGGISS